MSRVGNDVVDLDDPAIAASHLRPRFLERVLHPSERALLDASSRPKQLLWSFFAAKEAAFKALSRGGPPLVFAHRKFVVAADLGSVAHQAEVLRLRIEVEGACVHAVAWSGDAEPLFVVTAGSDPRALLLEKLGLTGKAQVVRDARPGSWDGFGPPRLEPDAGYEISLSHDGRFAGAAAYFRGGRAFRGNTNW